MRPTPSASHELIRCSVSISAQFGPLRPPRPAAAFTLGKAASVSLDCEQGVRSGLYRFSTDRACVSCTSLFQEDFPLDPIFVYIVPGQRLPDDTSTPNIYVSASFNPKIPTTCRRPICSPPDTKRRWNPPKILAVADDPFDSLGQAALRARGCADRRQ